HFRHNLTDAAAALDAAPERDNAEAARMRAAINNRYMGRNQGTALVGGQDQQILILDGIAEGTFLVFDLPEFVLNPAIPQEGHHRRWLGGSHKHIDKREASAQRQR